jgi:phospholipase/lecithinase/hemolysin
LANPAIDKTPLMLGQSSSARTLESSTFQSYNSLLASRLSTFVNQNAGVVGKVVDTSTAFNAAINNPKAYGAPDATCYNSDGTSCLWFNNYHPGIAINKLVAQMVVSAWQGTFF